MSYFCYRRDYLGTSNADYAPLDDPKLNETTSTSDVKIISCTATSLS
ncbi:unnamed protein product, partial [Rotaria magnacalcarata]